MLDFLLGWAALPSHSVENTCLVVLQGRRHTNSESIAALPGLISYGIYPSASREFHYWSGMSRIQKTGQHIQSDVIFFRASFGFLDD